LHSTITGEEQARVFDRPAREYRKVSVGPILETINPISDGPRIQTNKSVGKQQLINLCTLSSLVSDGAW